MRILHLFDQAMLNDCDYAMRSYAIVRQQREMDFHTEQVIINSGEPHPEFQDMDNSEVAVECENEDANANSIAEARINFCGIDFQMLNLFGLFSNIPILSYCREFFQLRAHLRKLADQYNPQIIHAHSSALVGLAAIQVGQTRNIPVIYELRSLWEDNNKNVANNHRLFRQLQQKLETHVIRSASAVIALCDSLRYAAVARGVAEEKIALVPNGGFPCVNPVTNTQAETINNDLKQQLGLQAKTLLGFVGTFKVQEGLRLLLQALPILLQGFPNLHLLLVGSGPEEDSLKQLAAELGLSGQITFCGKLEHEKLTQYFDSIDLLIYPRVSTPLTERVTPLIPLQAMAEGQVVLASDVGGHSAFIKHGDNGYLFKKEDKSALADAVVDVLNERSSWSFVRERAKSFIKNERDWASSVSNYKKLYSSLVMHEDA